MNERIKELAKQSCEQVFGGEFGEMKLTMLFAEKFAELIVLECASELSRVPGGYDSSLFYKNSRLLKEHFGIRCEDDY
jgi:hypothetical protein